MININDIKVGSYFINKNGEVLEVVFFSERKEDILFKYIFGKHKNTGNMFSVHNSLVLKNIEYRMASEEEIHQINKKLTFQ